jgi:tetratricopeptide (TPR) repeat protein
MPADAVIARHTPTLLIFDNVTAADTVLPWLPRAGMPCHVLMTTVLDRWDGGWRTLPVEPLSPTASVDLIGRIAGPDIATRFGAQLAQLADGLPVQIVPASATLAYEARRGRLDTATFTLTQEAESSFLGVYQQLDTPARLLLHAAAQLNPQRIPRDELQSCLTEVAQWSGGDFNRQLDACLDLHLLQGGADLRMHQLFAAFVTRKPVAKEFTDSTRQIVRVQARRMIEISRELATHPNRADLAAKLMAFSPDPARWAEPNAEISVEDGETVGRALYEIGEFDTAWPWFERAVTAKEKGDIHGCIDHDSLGISLNQVGHCLSSLGQYDAARPWFERAVAAAEKGDIHDRIDHDSLGNSLRYLAYCLRQLKRYQEAEILEVRAAQLDR